MTNIKMELDLDKPLGVLLGKNACKFWADAKEQICPKIVAYIIQNASKLNIDKKVAFDCILYTLAGCSSDDFFADF